MTWTSGPVTLKSNADYNRKYRESDKGKESRKRSSRNQTERDYLARPFIAWDGEGITLASSEHLYTSLQSSSGVSLHDRYGLQSHVIFDALCDEKKRLGQSPIHVIYGGGYDFNMFLGDLPYASVEKLYKTGRVYYGEYVLSWLPSKYLRIKRRSDGAVILINDVVSFFQKTFVAACDEYLGDRFIERELIVENKAKRGTFTHADQATVDKYNTAELENLVLLMTELRERLNKVGIRPSRWDGPGAIAVALLKREGVKSAMAVAPEPVAEAGRYAYAGGRFEVFQHGAHKGVWEYDINSAYPTALQYVPDLTRGQWARTKAAPKDEYTFGVYQVMYVAKPGGFKDPQPFWTRSHKGAIKYGYNLTNWYWAPEIKTAQAYVRKHGGKLIIKDGWRFVPDKTAAKPFAFVLDMYLLRQALKAAGDGAHIGVKLGLNSLYGKTCQRVGAKLDPVTNTWRVPPYHQLEWAGYVTSFCRARLLGAVLDRLPDVIAMETDAIFVRGEPLEGVAEGTGLGEWESTYFDSLAYGQSGFYTGVSNGKEIIRTRGIDRGNLTGSDLTDVIANSGVLEASVTRFIGAGMALQLNDWNKWRRWITSDKNVNMEPTGKRVHRPEMCCKCDAQDDRERALTYHDTHVPVIYWDHETSCAYPIPWINPDPMMDELEELSKQNLEMMGYDYE